MNVLLNNNIIKYINIQIINKNIKILEKIHNQIKPIYNSIDKSLFKIESNDYIFVIHQIQKTQLYDLKKFRHYVDSIKNITKISYKNITMYITDNKYIINAKEMLKIAYTFAKFKNINNNIIIYWFPIDKKRDFDFNEINDENLKESINNFNAFSTSGSTTGNLTIITRLEEATKLLLHELIHNYNIDGSNYHEQLLQVINNYENTKNSNNYKYEFCMYESYTELLSSYFSIIFRNINNIDIHNRIETEIFIEILYSYNTVCNIIKLNGYTSIDNFIKNGYFKGNICFYEYYYLKALMYNNFVIKFGINIYDFMNIYNKIMQIKPDMLLKQIFNNSYKQKNFKYIYY